MNRPLLISILLTLPVAAMQVGCATDETTPRTPAKAEPEPEDGSKTFRLVGKVTEVDRDEGFVNIDHEDIPGLMPPMAMDFGPLDPALLEDVEPGDEVEGTIQAAYQDGKLIGLELTDLVVTYPAPASPMILNLSSEGATLRPQLPELEVGQEVPDFAMTTQTGEPLRLSDLRGRVVVLTFVYTRCPVPEACPLMDKNFSVLSNQLGRVAERAEGVRLLSVSFDPEHDTPEVLAEHARRRGANPPLWTYAVASHDELRKVVEPLGMSYAPMTGEIRHSLSTAVIAPDGTLARLEKGPWEPRDLLGTIRGLLASNRG